jgi:hypothetical protein
VAIYTGNRGEAKHHQPAMPAKLTMSDGQSATKRLVLIRVMVDPVNKGRTDLHHKVVGTGTPQARLDRYNFVSLRHRDAAMIGDLLKQLLLAVGRFVGFHSRRMLHLAEKPLPSPPPEPPVSAAANVASTTTEASIAKLSNAVGLDPEYLRQIRWPCYQTDVPSQEVISNALYKMWTTFPGGHKWTHYFEIYESIFGPLRTEPLRILEIGIWHGASMKLWRKYFEHPKTIIVGVDVLSECRQYDAPETGVHVRIGNQADPAFLKKVVEEFGPFDLIMDDGSHFSSHIIASFNHLFSDGLKDTGIYFVEDLHANYWHPWRDSKKSFLDVCKELLEEMHAHYRNSTPEDFLTNPPSARTTTAVDVPQITTMIREMRFFDSIVAIYKMRREHVPYFVGMPE